MSKISSREEALFADALAQPQAQRGAFLAEACGEDAALLARIAALVAAHEGSESLMASSETARPPHALDEKAGDAIGRYKLLQKIGEGGCGVVWMAEQEEPVRRRVALKVIKLGMDTKAVVARFEAERQALAMMDHPNIAKVLDGGASEAGRPYFVMELVRGIPITKYCDENHLTPKERLELFIKVCQAIQHAHQKGVIHRDIKPSNILLTVNDGAPTPKVIDFGIAKATQGKLTEATVFTAFEQFIGTPVYMSPEQAEMSSLDIDTRSDIYSLGVLLYELLTGRPPLDPTAFAKVGVDQIRQQIREIEPAKPSRRLGTLDNEERTTIARLRNTAPAQLSILLRGDLDWIIMRCLEKDRTRRYDTANALAMDIQRHLRHEPVLARPPSTAYLLQKTIRRHRWEFAATAVLAGVMIVGAVVSTWQAFRAKRAEREQSQLREAALRAQASEASLRHAAQAQELAARRRAYASDMIALQQALAVENRGRALELLNRQRPQPGQLDLRGWEWRYHWQFCQNDAQSVLGEKSNPITSLSVSADGKWLAVAEQFEGGLSVRNLISNAEIRVPAGVSFVRAAFSPREPLLAIAVDPDLAAGHLQHRVLLWDATTRQVARELLLGDLGSGVRCTGLFFSRDGQTLVTSTNGLRNEICLWRITDGTKLASHSAPASGAGNWSEFAVSSDMTVAAYRTSDGTVRVLDLETGRERWTANEEPTALTFSPDGKILVTGGTQIAPVIRLWDVASGRELGHLEGHRNSVHHLLFWPDGKTFASAGRDQTIRLWDVNSGRWLHTLRGHKAEVWCLALLPDNTTLVSGCKDGSVHTWDTTARRPASAVAILPKSVGDWHFAATGDSVVTVANGHIAQWHGRNYQEEIALLDIGPINFVPQFAGDRPYRFASDCPLLGVGSADGVVQVWDWKRRMLVRRFTLESDRVSPLEFLGRGEKLIIGTTSDWGQLSAHEWDVASGRKTRSWQGLAGTNRFYSAFSPDGSRGLLLGYEGGQSRIDLVTGGETRLSLNLRQPGPPSFSADGTLFAVPSLAGYARIWDSVTFREVATFSGFMQSVNSVAFSPDGRRLATGGTGLEAMSLWDLDSHELVLTLEAKAQRFDRTTFSPDGDVLGSSERGNTWVGTGLLHLWRAPSWAEIEAAEKRAATRQARP